MRALVQDSEPQQAIRWTILPFTVASDAGATDYGHWTPRVRTSSSTSAREHPRVFMLFHARDLNQNQRCVCASHCWYDQLVMRWRHRHVCYDVTWCKELRANAVQNDSENVSWHLLWFDALRCVNFSILFSLRVEIFRLLRRYWTPRNKDLNGLTCLNYYRAYFKRSESFSCIEW